MRMPGFSTVANYLRELAEHSGEASQGPRPSEAQQDRPEEGVVFTGDAAYWEAHRQGSWQGEVRDGDTHPAAMPSPMRTRIAAATEDEYWSQHIH